jgi:hypothetical protein
MTVLSNPRLFIFITKVVALPLAGASTFSRIPKLFATAATALGSYLTYRLYRFAKPFLATKIETTEEKAVFTLPGEGDTVLPWPKIDLAGRCSTKKGSPFLFVYSKDSDKLITIPFEYENMKMLQKTLEEKTPFETFFFEPGMSLRAVLRDRFPGVGDGIDD